MDARLKLLYITAFRSSFINRDAELLKLIGKLCWIEFIPSPNWKLPFSLIKQLFILLFQIPKNDVLICQYVGYHTILPVFLSKLFKKPVVLFLLGGDCHNYPSINRGNFRKAFLASITRYCVKNATWLCPVHKSLIEFENHFYSKDPIKQGLKNQVKNFKTPFSAIPYGVDSNLFYPENTNRIPKSFITVSSRFASPVFENKGLDIIIELSKLNPDFHFSILGNNDGGINEKSIPSNLHLIKPGNADHLRFHLSQHQYYLQVSIAEGFPNALCEAMLCGCIPIGSNVFGIPDIIGKTGYILKKKEINLLNQIVTNTANNYSKELSEAARNRIVENYTPKIRLDGLKKVLSNVTA